MRTLHHEVLFAASIVPQSINNGTVNGAVVDTRGYFESLVVLNIGALTASAVLDVKVQHGDASDASDAADITGAAFTTKSTGDGSKTFLLRVRGNKRYLRAVAVESASHAVLCSVEILPYNPAQKMPTAQTQTVVEKEI